MECTCLGHVVGNGVVKPEVSKVQSIDQFTRPATKRQVRSFLGLTGYYCHFISNYATVVVMLTNSVSQRRS